MVSPAEILFQDHGGGSIQRGDSKGALEAVEQARPPDPLLNLDSAVHQPVAEEHRGEALARAWQGRGYRKLGHMVGALLCIQKGAVAHPAWHQAQQQQSCHGPRRGQEQLRARRARLDGTSGTERANCRPHAGAKDLATHDQNAILHLLRLGCHVGGHDCEGVVWHSECQAHAEACDEKSAVAGSTGRVEPPGRVRADRIDEAQGREVHVGGHQQALCPVLGQVRQPPQHARADPQQGPATADQPPRGNGAVAEGLQEFQGVGDDGRHGCIAQKAPDQHRRLYPAKAPLQVSLAGRPLRPDAHQGMRQCKDQGQQPDRHRAPKRQRPRSGFGCSRSRCAGHGPFLEGAKAPRRPLCLAPPRRLVRPRAPP
mmetsp:Transcript_101903/g.283551  ORF Transcript_101903/g.283551 Transcript_101903/m.283551 type:complete len:370 (-) Transcript_101903:333-1442(-)